MQVLTWAHKRHRLLAALAQLDSNVAARAPSLGHTWENPPRLADAGPHVASAEAPEPAAPHAQLPEARPLAPQLARAAATVEAARVASVAPAKPMRGETPATAPTPAASPTAKRASLPAGIQPGDPIPSYLQ